MNMKKTIKKNISSIRRKHTLKRKRDNELRKIQGVIKNYQTPVPELTEAEKQEINRYWEQYGLHIPTDWHRFFYAATGVKDPCYVPEFVFHQKIKPLFNVSDYAKIWGDKSYIDYFLRGVSTPRSVVRNVNGRFLDENFSLISASRAEEIMSQYERLVVKPSTMTDTGKGVQLLDSPYKIQDILRQYKKNFVIQIPLKQHEDMSLLNNSSINTIRVNSVLFDTDAHVMSAFVKVGQAGEFADNHGHDRFFIGIKPDGAYCGFAINHDLKRFDAIPSGFEFAGKRVPSFDEVCRVIEKAHKCLPHFGFVFWDVCVSELGEPVIVEANLRYPDTVIPQACGFGSFFGEYADRILKRYADSKK